MRRQSDRRRKLSEHLTIALARPRILACRHNAELSRVAGNHRRKDSVGNSTTSLDGVIGPHVRVALGGF